MLELYNRKERSCGRLKSSLHAQLVAGSVTASGRRNDPTAQVEAIESHAWPHLRISEVRRSVVTGPDKLKFYDVRIYPLTTSAQRAISMANVYAQCVEWLVALMRECPKEKQNTKDFYWEEAQAKWPNTLANRAFERAWDEAIDRTGSLWGKAGRPKKSPQ